MVALLTTLHVLIAVLLIVSILLQSSKGGGMAGVLGGGGAGGGVFGGRGAASFLAKVTMWLGAAFAVTSISIALLSSGQAAKPRSVVQERMQKEQSATPSDILPIAPGEGTPQQPTQ
jgi:preprotein translocase subunit SecG